jgi:hypothetical protein
MVPGHRSNELKPNSGQREWNSPELSGIHEKTNFSRARRDDAKKQCSKHGNAKTR